MQIVITDPAQVAAFRDPKQVIEFVDAKGEVIGLHIPDGFGAPPPGVTSRLTPEEAARRLQMRGGRPLRDILADLERREGTSK